MKTTRALLGNEITDRLPPEVWGLDSEGELNQTYRPTGHPALWFALGGFGMSRFFSKHLVSYLPPSIYIYIHECDDSGSPDLSKRARYSLTKGALLLYMIYLYRKLESQMPMLRLPWNNERRPTMQNKSSLCQSVACYHSGD